MRDLFKMRQRKHAMTQGKLLTATEHVRYPDDVEFRQTWRMLPLNFGGKMSVCDRHRQGPSLLVSAVQTTLITLFIVL